MLKSKGMEMEAENNKRITYKRARPNPVFQEWLEELYSDAQSKKSKLTGMLREALESITKYPLPLNSGAECAILKGFDRNLCSFLDKRLEVYKTIQSEIVDSSSGLSEHSMPSNETSEHVNVMRDALSTESQKEPCQSSNAQNVCQQINNNSNTDLTSHRKRKLKAYKPTFRSGGYALLIALLEFAEENPSNLFINKEDLIERAQKHSEESFVRPKPETHYTAWFNMSRLITKGLVTKVRNKKVEFSLSDTGKTLALELLRENKRTSVNDVIFNNAPQQSTSYSINSTEVTPDDVHLNAVYSASNSSEDSESSISPEDLVELPKGSFDIILLIDKCETGGLTKKNEPMVAQINKFPDMLHEHRSLKVGDFTWIAKHKSDPNKEIVLPYVIERKRMDDLGGSIKDGRFHEQKFRLRKCKLDNVIYLVENYGSNKHVGLPLQSLMQAIVNTRIVDGFMVHVTDSLTHTVRFLAMMTKRLTIEYKDKNLKGSDNDPQGDVLMTFKYFNKTSSKNRPLTVRETFIKMLLQVKGVSVEKALAITSVYSTPADLMDAYIECEDEEPERLLAKIRSVGHKTSKSLYHLYSM